MGGPLREDHHQTEGDHDGNHQGVGVHQILGVHPGVEGPFHHEEGNRAPAFQVGGQVDLKVHVVGLWVH